MTQRDERPICINCGLKPRGATYRRCYACVKYLYKYGVERPKVLSLAGTNQPRGETHGGWKGKNILVGSGHVRAQKAFPMGPCEECSKPGRDRHHVDGDTANNSVGNVQILCRRCHMIADGRMEKFLSHCRGLRAKFGAKA